MRRVLAPVLVAGLLVATLPGVASAAGTNYIRIGPSGWSGATQTVDAVAGWGADAWTFSQQGQPVTLVVTVQDCCVVGDNFVVYLDGKAIGVTPPVPYHGETGSSGTFTVKVRPAPNHVVTIQDVGGVTYNNVYHNMLPAGYSVSISYSY